MMQLSAISHQLSAKTFPDGRMISHSTISVLRWCSRCLPPSYSASRTGSTTREMVKYGLYCFAMFLGGVLVAGWAMWMLSR